jgi:hypothetical protein
LLGLGTEGKAACAANIGGRFPFLFSHRYFPQWAAGEKGNTKEKETNPAPASKGPLPYGCKQDAFSSVPWKKSSI